MPAEAYRELFHWMAKMLEEQTVQIQFQIIAALLYSKLLIPLQSESLSGVLL